MYLSGIVGALAAVTVFLKQKGLLQDMQGNELLDIRPMVDSPLQQLFVNKLPELVQNLQQLPQGMMDTLASWSADDLNQALEARGYSIRLDPWLVDYLTMGAIAILTQRVKWLHAGRAYLDFDARRPITVHSAGRTYHAFEMTHGMRIIKPRLGGEPIIQLDTREGETVLVQLASQSLSGFALTDACDAMVEEVARGDETKYQGAAIPHISYDSELTDPIDLSWLVGLELCTPQDVWTLAQVLQQNKLEWDENGALAQSATAVSVKRSSSDKLLLNKPFITRFVNSGFTAYIDQRSWKPLGSLGGGEVAKIALPGQKRTPALARPFGKW